MQPQQHQSLLSTTAHNIQSRPLRDSHIQQVLRRLSELFCVSRGPYAQLTLLRCANSSGHVTLTSSAKPLLQGLVTHKDGPVRFILSALTAHVNRWPDSGLLVSHLCTALVASPIELDLPRRLIAEARDYIIADVVTYLESDECECRVDVVGARSMLSLVSSVLRSKPTCHLDADAIELLSTLVLRAYLTYSPGGIVHYLSVTGGESSACELIEGILYEVPYITSCSLKRDISVAVYDVSLAGDSPPDAFAAVDVTKGVVWHDEVVARLLQCGERLIAIGMGVLACQRVVHPRLKRFMLDHGVLVIDRLGLRYIKALTLLTGATVLGDFNASVQQKHLGHLQSVSHRTINSKNYLHLKAEDKPVCTLVLHCRTEQACEELTLQCIAADGVLASTTQHPFALMGAGCWQSHLAGYIRKMCAAKRADWSESIGCAPSQLLSIADDFARVLEMSSRGVASDARRVFIDPRPPHHIWQCEESRSCQCGVCMVSDNDDDVGKAVSVGTCRVLDPYLSSIMVLKNAVAISNTAVLVEHFIQDSS